MSQNFNTYILVKKKADINKLERQLNGMLNRFLAPELKSVLNMSLEEFTKQGSFVKVSLTPLTSIHLYANKLGEIGANASIQNVGGTSTGGTGTARVTEGFGSPNLNQAPAITLEPAAFNVRRGGSRPPGYIQPLSAQCRRRLR